MNGEVVYQKYKNIQITTANRGELLIMLYQGCIKFLKIAKKGIKNDDIEMANNNIIKAQNIILELMNTLDRKNGGDIAENLYKLYNFMYRQLIDANIKKDINNIDIVKDMMVELMDTWEKSVNKKNNNKEITAMNVKG